MNRMIRKHYNAFQLVLALAMVSIFTPGSALAGKPGSRPKARGLQTSLSRTSSRNHRSFNNLLRSGVKPKSVPKRTQQHARIRCSTVKPNQPQVCTVDEAVKLVRSGHRVLLPTEAGTSQVLFDALAKRAGKLRGRKPVEVLHTASQMKYPDPLPSKLLVNGLFVNSGARKLVNKGLKITPTYLSEIPKLLDKQLKPHVIMIKVAPPDKRGNVNTGVCAGLVADFLADPKVKVIAEVNPNMPRTRGATTLHKSHIDRMVYSNEPLAEVKWGQTTAVDRAIGKNVASQVPNGATLQLGIGPIQKAVAEAIAKRGEKINKSGKQYKLRIRSEMIDDGLVALINAGVISKSRNAVQLGFAVGTKKLYDLLGKDRRVQMMPTRELNDVMKAGARKKLMAINSAVQVDLYGQACSEAVPREGSDGKIRPVPYSGVGGQVDFFRAVQRSKGGKGFVTLRSTAKNGTISSISLDLGSQLRLNGSKIQRKMFDSPLPVTTNRYDVDRVTTEWGTAKLKGKDMVGRAQALIKVAHPKFRGELAKQGQAAFGGNAAAWKKAAQVTQAERKLAAQLARDGQ